MTDKWEDTEAEDLYGFRSVKEMTDEELNQEDLDLKQRLQEVRREVGRRDTDAQDKRWDKNKIKTLRYLILRTQCTHVQIATMLYSTPSAISGYRQRMDLAWCERQRDTPPFPVNRRWHGEEIRIAAKLYDSFYLGTEK